MQLFRARIDRSSYQLVRPGQERGIGQSGAGGLGDAEIDDLGLRFAAAVTHEDIRGFQVAVDHAFLMGVLHTLTNAPEQLEPPPHAQSVPVAVAVHRLAGHQFHGDPRPAGKGHAGLEDGGDVRVFHDRERLPLHLESGQHFPRIHAGLRTFSATVRRIGSRCSARRTTPNPP